MEAIALELLTGGWNLIKMGCSALGKFLGSLNAQGVVGLIVALILTYCSFHEWGEARHWKKQSDRYEALYNQEHKAFGQTVLNYRAAAAKAKADDEAKNARTVAQQSAVNDERDQSYETRLAAAHAEYERLSHASAGTLGGGSVPPVSGLPSAVVGPSEASGQDGLPDRLLCTNQSIQLDELIKWVNAQHAIDPNGKAN